MSILPKEASFDEVEGYNAIINDCAKLLADATLASTKKKKKKLVKRLKKILPIHILILSNLIDDKVF